MKFFLALAALVAVAVASPLHKPLNYELAELEAIIAAIQSPSTDPATAALLEQQLDEILGVTYPVVGPAFIPTVPVGPVVEHEIKPEPISVGPAFIDFPHPDGGAVTVEDEFPAVSPVAVAPVSPVVVGPTEQGSPAPLVQIIVNVNQAAAGGAPNPGPVGVAPVVIPEADDAPWPIQIAENNPIAAVDPVIIAEPVLVDDAPWPIQIAENNPIASVDPVIIAEPVLVDDAPWPIQIAETNPIATIDPVIVAEPILPTPVAVEPVVIGNPILPAPVGAEPVIIGTPIIPEPVVVLPAHLN